LQGKRGVEPFEKKKADIQRMMQYDDRSTAAKTSFINKLKKEYDFKLNSNEVKMAKVLAIQYEGQDSMLIAKSYETNRVIMSFADQKVLLGEFMEFYLKTKNIDDNIDRKIEQITEIKLMQYEDSQLENKYEDFAHLMQEYHDGILLFEISNKEVWEKAIKDTEGLKKYFKKNKKNYEWEEPHFKGFVVKCADEATAKKLQKTISHLNPDSVSNYIRTKVNNDSVTLATVERGLWKQGENSYVDLTQFKATNVKVEVDEKLPVVIVVGSMLKKMPKSYTDVRGAVTADYQNYLEKNWIENLRNKYTVIVNKHVLNTLK
jgi:peptidyl-prolyl cis-trans isomerase SurA